MTVPPSSPADGAESAIATHGRFFYGWVIVGAAIFMLAGFLGTQLCFGLFLKPLSQGFGWTRAATSGAMSLSMGVTGLVGVLMGRFSDRYNMRAIIAVGAVAGTASYLLLATTDSLWQFYLYFGLGVGICGGCTYTPVTATVSKWFVERRALAIGVALTGIVVGQMVLSPVVDHVITSAGWRTAYAVLGIILFVSGIPAALLMGKKPRSIERRTSIGRSGARSEEPDLQGGYTVRGAARTAPFWMLMFTGLTMAAGFYIVISHIVPCAQDLGVSSRSASLILTVSGLGSLGGTLLAWWLAVRMGARRALLVMMGGQAVAMFLFMTSRSAWSFFLVSTVFGFAFGAATPVRMSMVPPLFGLKAVGSILGWATLFWSVGGVASPYLAGYIHDVTKSYDLAFVVGGALLVMGAATVQLWGSHGKKAPGS